MNIADFFNSVTIEHVRRAQQIELRGLDPEGPFELLQVILRTVVIVSTEAGSWPPFPRAPGAVRELIGERLRAQLGEEGDS